jgi:hypothetical protein
MSDHIHTTSQPGGQFQGKKCDCCSMSRRCFLAAVGTAAAGAALVTAGGRTAFAAGDLNEHIDIASFRPRPKVRIKSVVARVHPPYWLGWPGTSYDLEGHRKEYARQFGESAKRVGVELEDVGDPLESNEAVETFCKALEAEKPDAVLVSLQHLDSWRWADRIAKVGVPTIIFSPVGTCFTGHVIEISRRPAVYVIASLETPAMDQAFRIVRAKRQFEETRLLVVAGEERKESALDRLGAKVRYIPRSTLHELFARMPENEETHEVARTMFKHAKKVVEPSRQDGLNAARSYQTAKRLMKDEEANAITTDCLGMVSQKVVPTPPCMAASMFQDSGVTYGCEADVFGAMSLMLTSYLFDQPGYMNDPVPETVKNLLIAAHCVSGTKIRGFNQDHDPFILRSHSESSIGVSVQMLWPVGEPVTLVRFSNPNELILDTGTVMGNVDTPPAGGCRTSVEIAMDRIEDARDVLGFHQVVFWGNHRRDVQNFCQMYGIKVVNSPATPPIKA